MARACQLIARLFPWLRGSRPAGQVTGIPTGLADDAVFVARGLSKIYRTGEVEVFFYVQNSYRPCENSLARCRSAILDINGYGLAMKSRKLTYDFPDIS